MSEPVISDALRRAVNAAETNERFAVLATIEHPDLLGTVRINNTVNNIQSRGEVYLACFFEVEILDQDPERTPQARARISNVRRELVAGLRGSTIPCLITLEIVRASDPDYVELRMQNLEMRNVNYDELLIQGDLVPKRLKARKSIDYYFSPTVAPGLFS